MVTPAELLGLHRDADEREVKRAYAQRLKQARPDTDPIGFQRLHEIYQAALFQCRSAIAQLADATEDLPTFQVGPDTSHRNGTGTVAIPYLTQTSTLGGTAIEELAVPVTPVPVADLYFSADSTSEQIAISSNGAPVVLQLDLIDSGPVETDVVFPFSSTTSGPESVAFEFAPFFRELVRVAQVDEVAVLLAWLQSQPALWSLERKTRIGDACVTALFHERPALSATSFEAILHFFDLDHVQSGLDFVAVQALRRSLQLHWEFADPDIEERQRRLRAEHGNFAFPHIVRAVLRRIEHPFRWLRAISAAISPRVVADTVPFILHIFGAALQDVPPTLDRKQLNFWLQLADRQRASRARFGVSLARCVAITAALALLGFLIGVRDHDTTLIVPFAILGLFGSSLWMLYLLWQLVRAWQAAPEQQDEKLRWVRWAFLPSAIMLGVVFAHLYTPGVSVPLMLAATGVAIARWRARAGISPVNFHTWGLFTLLWSTIATILLAGLMTFSPELGACVPTSVWLLDLWKQRAHLRFTAR